MSNSPATAANKAALILLRLAFSLTGTLGGMFFLVHFGSSLPFARTALYGVAVLGGALILAGLANLFRELAEPRTPCSGRRTS